MAKVQLSGILSGLSGKHSGGVHLKGKSGQVLRKKVRPRQPASNYNAVVRARLASVQAAWAGLTAAQVLAWNELAKGVKKSNVFGDGFAVSGINLFQLLNNNLVNVGEAIIEDAPALGDVSLFATFSAAAVHSGATTLTFTATPVPANTAVIVKATASIPVGRQVRESDFRQVAVLAAAETSPYTLTTEYNAKFGAPGAAGKVIYFRAYHINTVTGQAGRPVQCSAVIS